MIQNKQTIGLIGVGNMGKSILDGLLKASEVFNFMIFDHHQTQISSLAEHPKVQAAKDNLTLVNECDVIILAVKPQSIKQTLDEIKTFNQEKRPLFISVAAGITLTQIQTLLGVDSAYPLVRVMPNTPATLQMAASGIYGINLNQSHKKMVETITSAIGKGIWIDDESKMDIVTALSGSGPAYFFYFCEQLIHAATQAGLSSDAAKALTLQTALGAASVAINSDTSLSTLREQVTSPGGTTAAGLDVLVSNHLDKIIAQVIDKASTRGKELSQELNS
jgi:pyrroline-5-carboxylate reductase